MDDAPSKESLERIPLVMMYRSLERLSIAIESCAKIGFEESSPTRDESHAQIWLALNDAQADAKLKLKHYQKIVEQARERDEAAEKLAEALEFGRRMVESTLAHVSHGGPSRRDAEEWVEMAQQSLAAWREREG